MSDFSILQGKSIVFIGGGNMAGAILSGLITANTQHALELTLGVSDRNKSKLTAFATQGIQTTYPDTAHTLIDIADVVVLAVKPQVFANVAPTLAPYIADKLILSVMAGISTTKLTKDLMQGLPPKTPQSDTLRLVRSMPNLPASIGMGATGLYASDAINNTDKMICDAIMASIGVTMWTENEDELHAVTAVAGSAPAYFFYILQAMIDKAAQMGLDESAAKSLAIATMSGAAALAKTGDIPTLCQQVTSRGGTTAAALQVLTEHDVANTIGQAMQACAKRSAELGELF